MWETDRSALTIVSGSELELFALGMVVINRTDYTVLTGFEGRGVCFWCGGELKGKLKRYCRGHMQLYYQHFEWQSASGGALRRADFRCENCGTAQRYVENKWGQQISNNLNVHHIVPLRGARRMFSAFNLPWNLIVLCLDCHHLIHRIMNNETAQLRRRLARIEAGREAAAALRIQPALFALPEVPDVSV